MASFEDLAYDWASLCQECPECWTASAKLLLIAAICFIGNSLAHHDHSENVEDMGLDSHSVLPEDGDSGLLSSDGLHSLGRSGVIQLPTQYYHWPSNNYFPSNNRIVVPAHYRPVPFPINTDVWNGQDNYYPSSVTSYVKHSHIPLPWLESA